MESLSLKHQFRLIHFWTFKTSYKGDHEAFKMLYHKYSSRLIGNLLRIFKQRELVEEIVQDIFLSIFLSIWNNRINIDPEQSLRAYIFRIASNKANSALRSAYYDNRMRSILLPIEEQLYTHIEEEPSREENIQQLEQLLDRLPPQRKKVYILCKLEGRSYKEVSQMLHISETTVNDHIRKANRFLKEINLHGSGALLLALLMGTNI